MNSITFDSTFANKEIQLLVVSTAELAEFILGLPNQIVTIATHLEEEDLSKPWPWHGIVCTKIFDVQSVLINNWTLDGGTPHMFDLPDYNDDVDVGIGEEQPEDCVQQMVDGLNEFRRKYGLENDIWYLNANHFEYLEFTRVA